MTAGDEPLDATEGSALNDQAHAYSVYSIDLSEISLAKLRHVKSPVLASCIDRLIAEVADSKASTAGFNSAV